jgi:23S rRNA (guanosine2251-2'-O)-methyltransferase
MLNYDKVNQIKMNQENIIIYGKHPVIHALKNVKRDIIILYMNEKIASDVKIKEMLESKEIKKKKFTTKIVDKKFLDKLCSGSNENYVLHQGIAILTKKLPEVSIYEFLKNIEKKEKSTVLCLDQVKDPHNIGAIMRNGAAFNIDAIILTKYNSPEESSIIAKTACGALDIVPIITITNLAQTIDLMKKHNFWSYGMSLTHKNKKNIYDVKFANKSLIIFGNEGLGLRQLTNEKIDYPIYIPMQNIDSLNVSSSSAILLFALNNKQ